MDQILQDINEASLKAGVPNFQTGDTVNVHFRIVEGEKERTQLFQGVVISRKGRGINEMAVVRKVVDEVGVERIFPVNSPMISRFEILRRADSRRAKLYFLRERAGKSRRLRDRRRGLKHDKKDMVVMAAPAKPAAPAKA